jgi:hypothetical protein
MGFIGDMDCMGFIGFGLEVAVINISRLGSSARVRSSMRAKRPCLRVLGLTLFAAGQVPGRGCDGRAGE